MTNASSTASQLEQLKKLTTVVADTGDFERKTPLDESTRAIYLIMRPYFNPLLLQYGLETTDEAPALADAVLDHDRCLQWSQKACRAELLCHWRLVHDIAARFDPPKLQWLAIDEFACHALVFHRRCDQVARALARPTGAPPAMAAAHALRHWGFPGLPRTGESTC